jgi:uncharacterized protein (TIGR00299 family) protein
VIAWVDASFGASGDMLLGALTDAGVPLGMMAEAAEKLAPGEVLVSQERVSRGGFAAMRCHVTVEDTEERRTWRDIEQLLAGAGLHENVRSLAHDVFARLAEAEGHVHAMPAEDVHFHEVGALDAIAEVVGVCAGIVHLGLDQLVVSKVSVGGGHVQTGHGRLPVPPPAVVELLRGVPSSGGPVDLELCTPTGAALLTTLADEWGNQPAMAVSRVGVGAGRRDPEGHANVLRLLVGDGDLKRLADAPSATTVDGSAMKKGRPAQMLSVLVAGDRADAVRREVHRQTSTIGVCVQAVDTHELEREMTTVEVAGHTVAVKVAAAARALGRPVKTVMVEAVAGARGLA